MTKVIGLKANPLFLDEGCDSHAEGEVAIHFCLVYCESLKAALVRQPDLFHDPIKKIILVQRMKAMILGFNSSNGGRSSCPSRKKRIAFSHPSESPGAKCVCAFHSTKKTESQHSS